MLWKLYDPRLRCATLDRSSDQTTWVEHQWRGATQTTWPGTRLSRHGHFDNGRTTVCSEGKVWEWSGQW